jgi:DNA-binding IclR family transcriptional regulator
LAGHTIDTHESDFSEATSNHRRNVEQARKIVATNQVRFAPYRTNPATVLGQIVDARRRGYGARDIGLMQGTKSISAWIRSPDGQPAAAITITAIRHRLNHRREGEVADILVQAAKSSEQRIVTMGALKING